MTNNKIAYELIRVAKLLKASWVLPQSNVSDKDVRRRERTLRRLDVPLPEKAALFNMIDMIAMRGKDPADISRMPEFRGWGREDFIKLNRRLKERRRRARVV